MNEHSPLRTLVRKKIRTWQCNLTARIERLNARVGRLKARVEVIKPRVQ